MSNSLTDAVQFRLVAHELKNNGSPTLIETAVEVWGWGQATWLLALGAVAAGAKVNFKVQESDDGSTGWTDIATRALAEIADTGDNEAYAVEVPIEVARKRYQRPVCTVADGAPGADLAIICALSRYSPSAAVVAPQSLAQRIA